MSIGLSKELLIYISKSRSAVPPVILPPLSTGVAIPGIFSRYNDYYVLVIKSGLGLYI